MGKLRLDLALIYAYDITYEATVAAEAPLVLLDEDKGRIKWDYKTKAWAIIYKDADGKVHTSAKGLAVPEKDYSGKGLAPSDYAKVRNDVLQKARASWNEKDKSGAYRFVL